MLAFALTLTIPPLARAGLDMTMVAIGTCLSIAAFDLSGWRAPVVFRPLTRLGQRSYEIYLMHMFVVFALFGLFLRAGKPSYAVPLLFATVIFAAGLVGALMARLYSEPLNRFLRARWQGVRVAVDSARPVETLPEGY